MIKRIGFIIILLLLAQVACNLTAAPAGRLQPTVAATEAEIPTTLRSTSTSQPAPTTEPSPSPTVAPQGPSGWIAFIGPDSNLRLVDASSGEERQLTQDGVTWDAIKPGQTMISYEDPQWSSDGKLLAYERQTGTPIESGYQYQFDLMVFELATGQSRPVLLNQQIAGYAWKPGAALIAYGTIIDTQYFLTHDSQYANGIWAVDIETGEPYELVAPQSGRPLIGPRWSPDGRFLGFDEVLYMEGSGEFAYYDFEAQQYTAWKDVIGSYSWSPDGAQIAYDRMAYTPLGHERIWLNTRQKDNERAFSPQYEQGYAFGPVFSPQGDRIAYLSNLGDLENTQYSLFVVEVTGSEGPSLGTFEQSWGINWSPDGKWLVLNSGPYENRQIALVSTADGATKMIAKGFQPAWQPVNP
jgi:Tol biopolymer transport system component